VQYLFPQTEETSKFSLSHIGKKALFLLYLKKNTDFLKLLSIDVTQSTIKM